jgi:uncharacterized protein (DUF885 family)
MSVRNRRPAYHLLLLLVLVLVPACRRSLDRAPPAARPQKPAPRTAGSELAAVLDEYFEHLLRTQPIMATYIGDPRYHARLENDLSAAWRAEQQALRQRTLERLAAIPIGKLSPEERDSHTMLRWTLEMEARASAFPGHLMPLNQLDGLHNTLAQLGSGESAQPFRSVADHDAWLARARAFGPWVDQAIANFRQGLAEKVVLPRILVERLLPQLAAHLTDQVEKSVFYQPVLRMSQEFPAPERQRLQRAFTTTLTEELIPAYRRLHDFLRGEYLPQARATVGWSELPRGAEWYRLKIEENTSTTMEVEEIHQLGLREVTRIHGEMGEVARQVGFRGPLARWFATLRRGRKGDFYERADELLQGFRDISGRLEARLPALFARRPAAGFEVRAVEAFRAAAAPAAEYVQPSADGSRPGIFYVNTADLKAHPRYGMETLFLHEAIPGHHFQIAFQQELPHLPRFRRFADSNAFVEGWALYCESLGRELGLFQEPMSYYGRLSDELLRAMRLVVDTGLHAKGWSRAQAIAYMRDNSTMSPGDIENEVDRYIAVPGQALGYKIGELTIARLRERARDALGQGFDLRAFHAVVLETAAVPLFILEARVERWIAARQRAAMR